MTRGNRMADTGAVEVENKCVWAELTNPIALQKQLTEQARLGFKVAACSPAIDGGYWLFFTKG